MSLDFSRDARSRGADSAAPRSLQAPLLAPDTWRRALLQEGVMAGLALAIAGWSDRLVIERRSLLQLGGGVLTWLNVEPRSRVSQQGGRSAWGCGCCCRGSPGSMACSSCASCGS